MTAIRINGHSGRIACIVWLLQLPLAWSQTFKTVSICDLFSDLSKWNGEMITVTGAIERQPGSRESGLWLSGSGCPANIEVKGIKFSNTINIADPEDKLLRVHSVDFVRDAESQRRLRTLAYKLDPKTEYIHATITGLFETRAPIEALVEINPAHPKGLRFGFGPQNPHPAQILVRTMTDLRIEKKVSASQKRGVKGPD